MHFYRKIKKNKSKLGGDWFHTTCIGLKIKINKLEKLNTKWLCKKCDNMSPIKTQLLNENRLIKTVRGDGNCLYRVLAKDKFDNPERHLEMRNILCKKLKELFFSEKYDDKWGAYYDADGTIRNPELRLIRDLANFQKDVFESSSDEGITIEERKK